MLNRCDFTWCTDLEDAYHLAVFSGCGGALLPVKRPVVSGSGEVSSFRKERPLLFDWDAAQVLVISLDTDEGSWRMAARLRPGTPALRLGRPWPETAAGRAGWRRFRLPAIQALT